MFDFEILAIAVLTAVAVIAFGFLIASERRRRKMDAHVTKIMDR